MTDKHKTSPPDEISRFLRSAEVRLRLWTLLEAGLWIVALGCVVLLLGIGARALREFWAFTPPVYAALAAVLAVWALVLLASRGFRKIPSDQVAFLIEQRHPGLNNSLISSVQLTTAGRTEGAGGGEDPEGGAPASGGSASLIGALLARTADAIGPIAPGDAVDRSRLRGPLWAAGVLAALTLVVGGIGPSALAGAWRLLTHPIQSMPPRALLIETAPAAGRVLLGRPVTLIARTAGRRTKTLGVEIAPEGGGGAPRVVEMTRGPDGPKGEGRFTHRTGPVRASFTYRAFIGGDSSEPKRLEAVPPPVVGEMEVTYTYPRYARLKREVRKGTGYVRALKGTEVTLSLKTNKPVESGRLVFQSGAEVPLDRSDPRNPKGRFIVMAKDGYRIVLRDRWGFENPDPVRYAVDVAPDRIPAVELLSPKGELTVNGGETLTLSYLARDDFGLEDIRLVVEVAAGGRSGGKRSGSAVGRREFLVSKIGGAKRWESGRYDWDLRDLGLAPGAVITARLAVRDNDAISGPKEGFSKSIRIRVRNPEDEHKRVKDLQKNLTDRMLNLLGDQLELEADAAEKLGESPDGLPREDARPEKGGRRSAGADPPFTREDANRLRRRTDRMEEGVRELIAQIDRTLSRVARDRRSGYDSFADLNALRSNLFYLHREMMPRARKPLDEAKGFRSRPGEPRPGQTRAGTSPQEALRRFKDLQKDVTRELERMSVFADDIGKRGQLRDVARLARRLAGAQNRMLDAFDRAKAGDPAARKALQEALAKLQDLLNKLTRSLRNLPTQLPDEFLNMPTGRMMNLGNLSKQLQEIQRRLRAGDLEGARKLAEQMVKSLSRMMAALQGAMQQARNQAAGRFGRSAQRQQGILQKLIERQRKILADTRKIEKPVEEKFREVQREAMRRAKDLAEKSLNALSRLGRKIRDVPAPFRSMQEDYPGEKEEKALRRSVSREKVPEAAKSASALGGLSHRLAKALSNRNGDPKNVADRSFSRDYERLGKDFDRLVAALGGLPKDPKSVLTPGQIERLATLKKEQKEVETMTVEVRKRVERIMKVMPFLSPEIARNLGRAGDAMGKSVGALGARRADRAVPPERDAIYWLSRAGSNMRSAMQQMARRGRFGGAPAPSVLQPGGRPALALQWRPNVGDEEGGRSGASTRDFRLPGKEAYKVPKVYREEVVDALKGKYPPVYREQIEQYFKNLVE